MKQFHSENPSTQTAAAAAGVPRDQQGAALDQARAEFRAAWQAKQERAELLRGMARTCSQVDRWARRLVLLLCLGMLCVAGASYLLNVLADTNWIGWVALGVLGLILVEFVALVAEARLRGMAGTCSRVARWAGRLVLLLCLGVLCLAGASYLLNVPVETNWIGGVANGVLGLILVEFVALVVEARLRWYADRLEKAEVRHP